MLSPLLVVRHHTNTSQWPCCPPLLLLFNPEPKALFDSLCSYTDAVPRPMCCQWTVRRDCAESALHDWRGVALAKSACRGRYMVASTAHVVCGTELCGCAGCVLACAAAGLLCLLRGSCDSGRDLTPHRHTSGAVVVPRLRHCFRGRLKAVEASLPNAGSGCSASPHAMAPAGGPKRFRSKVYVSEQPRCASRATPTRASAFSKNTSFREMTMPWKLPCVSSRVMCRM